MYIWALEKYLKQKKKKPKLRPGTLEPNESNRNHKIFGNPCYSTLHIRSSLLSPYTVLSNSNQQKPRNPSKVTAGRRKRVLLHLCISIEDQRG